MLSFTAGSGRPTLDALCNKLGSSAQLARAGCSPGREGSQIDGVHVARVAARCQCDHALQHTDAGCSTPRAAVQHSQHCRSWSHLRGLRESGICVVVASHAMLTHPAKAGPLAGDKGANHRVAACAIAVVQPAVRDVQGAALDLPRLRGNKVDLSAGRTVAVQCAPCSKLQARNSLASSHFQLPEATQLSTGRCSGRCLPSAQLQSVYARAHVLDRIPVHVVFISTHAP